MSRIDEIKAKLSDNYRYLEHSDMRDDIAWLLERVEIMRRALERVGRETQNTPLLTDGAIIGVREALAELDGVKDGT